MSREGHYWHIPYFTSQFVPFDRWLGTLYLIIFYSVILATFDCIILAALRLLQDVEIEEEVDVIVSEWMGYMLLYEVLLQTCRCYIFSVSSIFCYVLHLQFQYSICISHIKWGFCLSSLLEHAGECHHC